MQMKKINSLSELKEERNRLLLKEKALMTSIKIDLIEIKETLKPINLVMEEAGKLLKTKNESGFLAYVTNNLAQFLIELVFKNSGFVTKFLGSYLAKNAAANFIASKKSIVLNWFSSLLHKNKNGSATVRGGV